MKGRAFQARLMKKSGLFHAKFVNDDPRIRNPFDTIHPAGSCIHFLSPVTLPRLFSLRSGMKMQ